MHCQRFSFSRTRARAFHLPRAAGRGCARGHGIPSRGRDRAARELEHATVLQLRMRTSADRELRSMLEKNSKQNNVLTFHTEGGRLVETRRQ